MKNKALIICAMAALMLSGCTKSNILASGGPAEPVLETQQGIVLDWPQIGSALDDEFLNNEEYPMALEEGSINYSVDQNEKTIELNLVVKSGTNAEEAVRFADAVIRYLNDEAATQDFSYERSSDTSYGGFFKEYDMHLIVMPEYTMEQKQYWLVDMDIPKGSDEKIVPKEGAVLTEPESEVEEDEDQAEDETEETEETTSAK